LEFLVLGVECEMNIGQSAKEALTIAVVSIAVT